MRSTAARSSAVTVTLGIGVQVLMPGEMAAVMPNPVEGILSIEDFDCYVPHYLLQTAQNGRMRSQECRHYKTLMQCKKNIK